LFYTIMVAFIHFYLTLLYFDILWFMQGDITERREGGEREGRMTTQQHAAPQVHTRDRDENLKGTETKSSFKTTELIVYALAVLGVLIASAIVDNSFGADPAWRYVTYLTVGYMISRGLAKSGSREPNRD